MEKKGRGYYDEIVGACISGVDCLICFYCLSLAVTLAKHACIHNIVKEFGLSCVAMGKIQCTFSTYVYYIVLLPAESLER
jgi:hypothetical protein